MPAPGPSTFPGERRARLDGSVRCFQCPELALMRPASPAKGKRSPLILLPGDALSGEGKGCAAPRGKLNWDGAALPGHLDLRRDPGISTAWTGRPSPIASDAPRTGRAI